VFKSQWVFWMSVFFIVAGIVLVGVAFTGVARHLIARQLVTPTQVSEPIIPTRTSTRPIPTSVSLATRPIDVTRVLTLSPTMVPTPTSTRQAAISSLYQGHARWGVGVAIGPITRYNITSLGLGWYLDWQTRLHPTVIENVEYVQMIRITKGVIKPDVTTLTQIARANTGSLWFIGNEPDVKWQDNVEPAMYARLYNQAYKAIKAGDGTAHVAIGGVTQPTPLRLKYLDAVLTSYRQQFNTEMPIDVWNVHNFILREERGSWGVDIPPGMSEDRGILYEVDDSGNLEAFRKQIIDFRRWMSERGYRNNPLIVSEYGIPMPEDYGFPPERVTAFLTGTFDFFLTAQDPLLGYAADDNRLVQRWCWYSLDDTNYATGRLFDSSNGKMTETGKAWMNYATHH
jgi:hypothetical protein